MNKKIYLTVDDGPSSHTVKKLQLLLSLKIPAIWFCRGECLEKHLESIVFAIQNGFLIGNHSYSHPYFSKISFEKAREEILQTESLIERAYQLSGVAREKKLFRFPYLDKGGEVASEKRLFLQAFLKEQGFERLALSQVNYRYYLENHWDQEIDVPWTFDAREYALFSERYMQKYGLFEVDDFLKLLRAARPGKRIWPHNCRL
ncbi:MAG: polysaccharide deacetylase [Chlamydiales bacterium]|nr:polysaccharide deacetylase [Chlamydiales bacterium]